MKHLSLSISRNKKKNEFLAGKKLQLNYNNKILHIEIINNWYVDGTKFAKFFGRVGVHDWLRNNKHFVNCFQKKIGKVTLVSSTRGCYGRVLVHFKLIIEIAKTYDKSCALQMVDWFEQQQRSSAEIHIRELEECVANFRRKKPKVTLGVGPYLYGFECNSETKHGDSLTNPDGAHHRTNSHATSVPGLKYGYIIYMDETIIIKFRELLREKFPLRKNNRDHFMCPVKEAENFIIAQCELIGWDYCRLSKEDLDDYNASL